MRRTLVTIVKTCLVCSSAALVLGLCATPAASAQQTFSFYVGGFVPRSEDARTENDVLVNDLQLEGLAFNISDFHSLTFGGEYLVGLGNKLEAGLGIGFHQNSVPSVYADVVNSSGAEIEQTLKLRVIPFGATVRFLPLGHQGSVIPYIGGGVGVFRWRYSETGEFVDQNNAIFRDSFVADGSAVGPLILGGIRVPFDTWGIGLDLRYQAAEGELPSDAGFVTNTAGVGPKIDLGGFTYTFSVNFRF
jgi:hypothetical protein